MKTANIETVNNELKNIYQTNMQDIEASQIF